MKCIFILDENVLIAALKCNETANKLIYEISKRDHIIAVTIELHSRYWQALSRYKKSVHHPFLVPLVGGILRYSTKCEYLTGPFQNERGIAIRHRKDVFLAQIAKAINSPSLIVSSDNKTRKDLNSIGLISLNLNQALAVSESV